MFRFSLGIPLLLTAVFGSLPVLAAPVDYVINFTLTGGSPLPTSGTFTYDSGGPGFTAFLVEWSGFTFDLAASANAPFIYAPADPIPCLGGATGHAASFLALTACLTPPPQIGETSSVGQFWVGMTYPDTGGDFFAFNYSPIDSSTPGAPFIQISLVHGALGPVPSVVGYGPFSAIPSAVPEPSTLALTLVAGVLSARKRIAQGLRQAARKNR